MAGSSSPKPVVWGHTENPLLHWDFPRLPPIHHPPPRVPGFIRYKGHEYRLVLTGQAGPGTDDRRTVQRAPLPPVERIDEALRLGHLAAPGQLENDGKSAAEPGVGLVGKMPDNGSGHAGPPLQDKSPGIP